MGRLYIAMYHYTRDLVHSRYPEIRGLDINLFKQQIQWFTGGGQFNPVRMEEVLEAVEGRQTLPDNALLLTFDDGYIDNFTFALPILQEYGVQGSFFIPGKTFATHQLLDVNKIHYILASASNKMNNLIEDLYKRLDYYRGSEFEYPSNEDLYNEYAVANRFDPKEIIFVKRILQNAIPEKVRNMISSELFKKYVGVTEEQLAYELYMTEDQIRTMRRQGMYIGIHGYDHYWLGKLTKEQMQTDIDMALDVMNEFINPQKWVMNYPYGNYSEDVLNYIKSKGATMGLTTEVDAVDFCKFNPLTMPRFDCNDFPPKSNNFEKFI